MQTCGFGDEGAEGLLAVGVQNLRLRAEAFWRRSSRLRDNTQPVCASNSLYNSETARKRLLGSGHPHEPTCAEAPPRKKWEICP